MSSDEDHVPQLSAETFAALQEFYNEQDVKNQSLTDHSSKTLVSEDWQLSQFWYDQKTIDTLTDVAVKVVSKIQNPKIALISCPSLYKTLKSKVKNNCDVTIYEYDKRFAMYGTDFEFYDYKSPLNVPKVKEKSYDIVIADPPFLSDECLTKTAVTIKLLAKDKIVLCTGAVMEELAGKLLGLKKCEFEPQHERNLANEFYCYSNFNLDCLINKNKS